MQVCICLRSIFGQNVLCMIILLFNHRSIYYHASCIIIIRYISLKPFVNTVMSSPIFPPYLSFSYDFYSAFEFLYTCSCSHIGLGNAAEMTVLGRIIFWYCFGFNSFTQKLKYLRDGPKSNC